VVADLSSAEGVSRAVEEVKAITGERGLDVLVNNVGIFGVKDFWEIGDEEWERYFQVNVMSGVRLCRAFLKDMLDRNRGSIIFVSSEAALAPKPFMVHYSLTKTAQLSLTRSLAELTKHTSVRVNAVLPGPTATEGVDTYLHELASKQHPGKTMEEVKEEYVRETEPTSLVGRFVEPREVANTVAFLASEVAAATNGAAWR
ncbi:hypothetical protein HK102_006563, partial [Quaeritorhiza haematococci]